VPDQVLQELAHVGAVLNGVLYDLKCLPGLIIGYGGREPSQHVKIGYSQ